MAIMNDRTATVYLIFLDKKYYLKKGSEEGHTEEEGCKSWYCCHDDDWWRNG
jgi:hypothetical protein